MARSDFKYFHALRVRFSEIDAQGIVYNAHYLTYCDIALTEYMRDIGVVHDLETARASGEDAHLVKATIEWKAPARADQELEIGVRGARIGRSSLTFRIEMFPKSSDQLLAQCEIIWVNTHQESRKSVPLDPSWVTKIRAYEGSELS